MNLLSVLREEKQSGLKGGIYHFFYRGLSEYPKVKGYLIDTCLSAQDNYRKIIDYFFPKSNNL